MLTVSHVIAAIDYEPSDADEIKSEIAGTADLFRTVINTACVWEETVSA